MRTHGVSADLLPIPDGLRAPPRGSPVSAEYDEKYGGFLGFRVEDSYYSSLDTLPNQYREYIVGVIAYDNDCKNGHPRKKFGTVNSQGYFRCRHCDSEAARERRKKAAVSAGQRP